MKYIYLNLKRFDIPKEYGGVNTIAKPFEWGSYIVAHTKEKVKQYEEEAKFVMYFPEAHLISAIESLGEKDKLEIGCQSVYREDTQIGGNFGAFTSNRTANAMKALGCQSTIIGHCEERNDKLSLIEEAAGKEEKNSQVVSQILNKEIKAAIKANLTVLYCIGEKEEEQSRWQEVLKEQLEIGLQGVEKSKIVIAYEPVWAIGPGKIPPERAYIEKIARFIKAETQNIPVVYGGGLKADNAKMLASIPEIDGGLIALTRFQGEIGFYPEEYIEIVQTYLQAVDMKK